MTLSAFCRNLLDDAESERKRWGGSEVSLIHVVAALQQRQVKEAEDLGSMDQLRTLIDDEALRGSEVVEALLTEVGATSIEDADRIAIAIGDRLRDRPAEAAAPDPAGSEQRIADQDRPEAAPHESTSWIDSVGDWLKPAAVPGRDALVDTILMCIGRSREPVSPLLVGRPGVGRTAVLTALASRLSSPDYSGPLAGHRVFRVRPHSLAGRSPGTTLRNLAQEVGPDSVLCIDDLEVAASLSRAGADFDLLRTVRTLVADQRPRIVLTIDEAFASQIEAVANELNEELQVVPVPLLDDATIREVVSRTTSELRAAHEVQIPEPIIELALAPAPNGRSRSHPGLALSRLDEACVVARLAGRDEVIEADITSVGGGPGVGPIVPDGLAERLSRRVRGQAHAVRRITEHLALTRAAMDLRPHRPDGVFLLVGPTGVGKTELAKALADELFGGQDALIRLDMTEYAHEWALSQITGPPPGYVGSTDPGSWLTTKILGRPDSVLLLDEFEKAHPSIWNTFLQAFDDGRLTDSMGRTVDFSKVVVVMTSNLGAGQAARTPIGFSSSGGDHGDFDRRMRAAAKEHLAPEFINRLDEVIVFQPLDQSQITEIARDNVEKVVERYRTRGFQLEVPPEVIEHVATLGYDDQYGARHLLRNIEQLLLEPLVGVQGRRLTASLGDDGVEWKGE